jgi:rhodanese-related sulfurtransferase
VNFFLNNITNLVLLALVVLSGLALLLPALSGGGGKTVTPLQATLMINKDKAAIVDVRSAEEFAAGHLREARHIPLAELGARSGELDKFRNRPVIVVCQTGARAGRAATMLAKAGYTGAVGLQGGLAAWTAGGLPVTKEA